MPVINLSTLRDDYLIGAEGLGINDYEVCKLLSPYIEAAIGPIESYDRITRAIEIRPTYVRAYAEKSDGFTGEEFMQVPLPKGLYAHARDLSAGPFVPFPIVAPPVEEKAWLGRLHRVLFPGEVGEAPKHVVMNAENFGTIRSWLRDRFDPCSQAVDLKRGFMGVLHEKVLDASADPLMKPDMGRHVQVWISRSVPVGEVRTTGNVMTLAFDWTKATPHALPRD